MLLPEGGHTVLNHVIATDVVSAAAPHFGQVRVYALADDLQRLHTLGDDAAARSAWTDLRSPALPALDFAVFPAFALTTAR